MAFLLKVREFMRKKKLYELSKTIHMRNSKQRLMSIPKFAFAIPKDPLPLPSFERHFHKSISFYFFYQPAATEYFLVLYITWKQTLQLQSWYG